VNPSVFLGIQDVQLTIRFYPSRRKGRHSTMVHSAAGVSVQESLIQATHAEQHARLRLRHGVPGGRVDVQVRLRRGETIDQMIDRALQRFQADMADLKATAAERADPAHARAAAAAVRRADQENAALAAKSPTVQAGPPKGKRLEFRRPSP
jgi:hypothetical protein